MGLPRHVTAVALLAAQAGCASRTWVPPAPGVATAARAAQTYAARLRVRLDGKALRARTGALAAFRRPDALRVEIPGPLGARFVAVARGGTLRAVFPAERAFFEGGVSARDLEDLLGIALRPEEIMDLLVGVPAPGVRAYQVSWGPVLPRRLRATLRDGARLDVTVQDASAGDALPPSAFELPAAPGHRRVDAEEARGLWSRP
jgi:hypothetical protein